jgi:hypothetical protein
VVVHPGTGKYAHWRSHYRFADGGSVTGWISLNQVQDYPGATFSTAVVVKALDQP